MIVSVHQPQYLPWIGYFDKIANSDTFVFLDRVQYKGREYQNRNRIRARDGAIWLTVPVVSKGKYKQGIWEAKIDNDFPWRRQHLNSLKSSYGKAPFFDRYLPFFEETYRAGWETLVELNRHIIIYLLGQFGIVTPIKHESEMDVHAESTDRIIDICRRVGADTYLSGAGGKSYMEEEKFPANGIKLEYQHFVHPVYKQQFMKDDKDFLPYMSAVDLLFNEGPAAGRVLTGDGGV